MRDYIPVVLQAEQQELHDLITKDTLYSIVFDGATRLGMHFLCCVRPLCFCPFHLQPFTFSPPGEMVAIVIRMINNDFAIHQKLLALVTLQQSADSDALSRVILKTLSGTFTNCLHD